MRQALLITSIALLFAGCSEFNRALKSDDLGFKFMVAENNYIDGDYEKALPLLEELIALTRGSQISECVYYLHAKSFFGLKDYTLAGYYLAQFTKTFPASDLAEECAFLSAYCHYKNSPVYTLDQTDTQIAIDQLQLFMVRYPETELRDSANTLIDGLRLKLEKKDFSAAKQYLHTRKYTAAGQAFRRFLHEWPTSDSREEAIFLQFKADQSLAVNSVITKKKDRLEEANRSYLNFVDPYPASKYMGEAQRLYDQLILELERMQSN